MSRSTEGTVPRRQIAQGLAWSVPVLAASAAAPAMAASGCPTVSVAATPSGANDRITLTSTGGLVIPTGATVTWVVQNANAFAAPLTLAQISPGIVQASPPPASPVAPGDVRTVVFTVSAPFGPGDSVWWEFAIANYYYNSQATLSFVGTSLAGCPSVSGCASDRFNVPGSTCPTSGLAGSLAAGRTSAPTAILGTHR